jgi:hypothetical protein
MMGLKRHIVTTIAGNEVRNSFDRRRESCLKEMKNGREITRDTNRKNGQRKERVTG